jgi:hypothetical protein
VRLGCFFAFRGQSVSGASRSGVAKAVAQSRGLVTCVGAWTRTVNGGRIYVGVEGREVGFEVKFNVECAACVGTISFGHRDAGRMFIHSEHWLQ